jgi:serine/threonine protein kinase
LSGIHPFQIEENEEKMLDNIERGDWPWLGSNWDQISEQGKDLVAKLMHPDPNKRLTIKEALSHPWIEGHGDMPDSDISGVRDELKKFQARKRFRGAIFAVAASNRLRLAALALKGSQSRDSMDSDDVHNDEVEDNHEASQEDAHEEQGEEQHLHATQSEPTHTEVQPSHSSATTHSTQSHTAQHVPETRTTHTVSAPASTSATYSYDQLKTGANWPSGVDAHNREVSTIQKPYNNYDVLTVC